MSAIEWEFWSDRVFIDEDDRTTCILFDDILQIEWYEVPGTPDVRTVCDQPALAPVHNVVFRLRRDGFRVVVPDQSRGRFENARNRWTKWVRR